MSRNLTVIVRKLINGRQFSEAQEWLDDNPDARNLHNLQVELDRARAAARGIVIEQNPEARAEDAGTDPIDERNADQDAAERAVL